MCETAQGLTDIDFSDFSVIQPPRFDQNCGHYGNIIPSFQNQDPPNPFLEVLFV